MLRFNDIADRILEYNPACDLALLQRAYVFTAKVHEGQERLSGEPYLVHPLEVAGILVEMRMDDVTVAAGLLHDAVEDTLASIEEIERLFGEEVAFVVDGLTKIAKIEFTSARERQAENFRKMLVAMSKDIRILLIKLADRMHNMRTLDYMSEGPRQRIAQETLDIYAPLAHRLGIHWMKQELEELAFRTIHPEAVESLEDRLHSQRQPREAYIEEVIGTLSERLREADLEAVITGRLKDLSSIHSKMESQGLSLDEIYDVIAFRVIVGGEQENVYAALGIAHSIWRPVPGRFKDYVALPKPNGYQSLHTTVIGPYGERMEVQIRTGDMHRNAEFGIAAHWKYKEGRADDPDDAKFAWLSQLLEWQRDVADPHERWARPLWTSPTRSTARSALIVPAPVSTARWFPCAIDWSTGTPSKSSPVRRNTRARIGSSSSLRVAHGVGSVTRFGRPSANAAVSSDARSSRKSCESAGCRWHACSTAVSSQSWRKRTPTGRSTCSSRR
jgi:GTP pyrophosphokinase